ncbi:MAG: DUF58 domain-containing protein [Akkermansia sp.]|nr:DUF58 domain-containing protein [Akkermansia sp.]
MADTPSILRPEDMARLASYRFAVQMMAEGWLSGHHRAKGRGGSTDFLEYREYSPGDDLRLIDWRVYARTDRMQLKTFENETHLECHLFVDSSASMAYREEGPLSKLQYASHLAACIAWLVVRGNDRVSLQLFDEKIRKFIPAGSTAAHLNQCLHCLEYNKPGGKTDLPEALAASHHLLTRAGTLVIVSDFLCDVAALRRSLNIFLHRGCKIVLVQVLDAGELQLSGSGVARYVDMETGEKLTCNLADLQEAYATRMAEHLHALRAMAASAGMLFFTTRTDQSFYPIFDALSR